MSGKPIDGVVQALIEVAVGKVQHLYRGTCPDAIEGFDSRDPQCPACRVLTAAQQPAAEEQLTYKGVPIGPMQTFADMERQASAPVGVDWITGDGLQGIKAEAHFLTQHTDETVQRVGRRLIERVDKIIAALAQQPAAVDEAAVDRVAAALLEEATNEPWTVAGVEYEGPDRDYYRKLARKVLALAAQHQEPKS